VKKGALLLQIRQDNYKAVSNSAEAGYKLALGARSQAEAEYEKAELQFRQNEALAKNKLISPSVLIDFKTSYEVARLRLENSKNQVDQARFAVDKAKDDLSRTTITSPIDGTVTKLKSQLGERVLGTSFNMGTEIMTIAKLDEMEARVDIGEIDVVLIEVGQTARIEVDPFKDQKFKGTVTAIANASKSSSQSAMASSSSQSQDAPKFEVKIRIEDKAAFRPGMSVTAEVETRSRKGVLAVPIQSVTTRLPPKPTTKTPAPREGKAAEPVKPLEVVFALEGDHVKMVPVKTGISDNDWFEIISGLTEGQEIVAAEEFHLPRGGNGQLRAPQHARRAVFDPCPGEKALDRVRADLPEALDAHAVVGPGWLQPEVFGQAAFVAPLGRPVAAEAVQVQPPGGVILREGADP